MAPNSVKRPRRWDHPFCDAMKKSHVDWVLSTPHFKLMEESNFPRTLSLRNIVLKDCRIKAYEPGQVIVSAGGYINSAFLMLSGEAKMILTPGVQLTPERVGKKIENRTIRTLFKYLSRNKYVEVRDQVGPNGSVLAAGKKNSKFAVGETQENVPIVANLDERLSDTKSELQKMVAGDIFGETAVLGRTAVENTVVATRQVELLEIRWQGLRDICKFETGFKSLIDKLYRDRGLYQELLKQPLLKNIEHHLLKDLAQSALYEVHGHFDWHKDYQQSSLQSRSEQEINDLIQSEPLVAEEGNYADGVLLIRSGFARLSRKINHGHYTLSYLSRGDLFGLEEAYDSWLTKKEGSGQLQPIKCSLRALGYTDIIRIPTSWMEKHVFSQLADSKLQAELATHLNIQKSTSDFELAQHVDRKLTEFMVENRFINGTQTMLIDMERCVRCDDCVSACTKTHDGNPRFNRDGQIFDKYMVASACMHCDDPVCMIGCPTGAIHRSPNGQVEINDSNCIGCSTCANSCPYNNIQMVPISDNSGRPFFDERQKPIMKATKCDLCSHITGGPACQRACSHDALIRIDLKETEQLANWLNR